MWCDVFRYRFTRAVDNPTVKKSIGAAFVAFMGLGFVLAYVAGDRYRNSYCKDHNCNHVISNDDGTFEGVMIGLGILTASATLVCLSVMCIICCRLTSDETSGLIQDDERASRYGGVSLE